MSEKDMYRWIQKNYLKLKTSGRLVEAYRRWHQHAGLKYAPLTAEDFVYIDDLVRNREAVG